LDARRRANGAFVLDRHELAYPGAIEVDPCY
jgi:hypothetical protein